MLTSAGPGRGKAASTSLHQWDEDRWRPEAYGTWDKPQRRAWKQSFVRFRVWHMRDCGGAGRAASSRGGALVCAPLPPLVSCAYLTRGSPAATRWFMDLGDVSHPITVSLAVTIYSRWVARAVPKLTPDVMKTVATACMLIAFKLEEVATMPDALYHCTAPAAIDCELQIVNDLHGRLHAPSTLFAYASVVQEQARVLLSATPRAVDPPPPSYLALQASRILLMSMALTLHTTIEPAGLSRMGVVIAFLARRTAVAQELSPRRSPSLSSGEAVCSWPAWSTEMTVATGFDPVADSSRVHGMLLTIIGRDDAIDKLWLTAVRTWQHAKDDNAATAVRPARPRLFHPQLVA